MRNLILVTLLFLALNACSTKNADINIDTSRIVYKMAGGIGASWHAISEDTIDESPEYKWANRTKNNRGSAWGGNPPVTHNEAWEQIYRHASWLGMSFVRVELSARMYEPEKDKFDWENEEMQALYKILDWAEANDADVFLQQMWSNVKWNSYPGVQPLLSAPKSVEDFAEGFATLAEYLTVTKKYSCIKWLCITNEPPGGSWGSWWSMGETNPPVTPAWKAVRKALDKRNITIPISGPDWTDLPVFDASKIDFDEYIGAYDIHSYQGIDAEKQKIVADWARWAKERNKPMFLSEIGDMRIGWKDSNPGPKSFAAALSNAESVLRGLSVGVSGFNRWSFTNRGDLDGQWQLIRTWDIENQKYFDKIEPEPVAFYGYGIITRFMAKHSSVVFTDTIANSSLLSHTLKSDDGKLTTYILNKSDSSQSVTLKMTGSDNNKFYLYRVTEEELTRPEYKMDPLKEIEIRNGKIITIDLPARSINTLSTYKSMHSEIARKPA
jgi:hypothetical protein